MLFKQRDTNSLWNIDQRAILYPADIPTDESSLMAQYLYEQRMNNQVSAALETFWSKNKVIIESPLATSAASSSAIRSKFFFQKSGGGGSTSSGSVTDYSGGNPRNTTKRFGSYSVNSPLCVDMKPGTSGGGGYSTNAVYYSANNYQRHYYQQQHHPSSNSENRNAAASSQRGQPRRVAKRDQGSQTVLTLPVNFDLSQIKELRQFFVNNENDQDTEHTSPSRVSASLNNSIRKKLFDPDDLSSTATTTTAMSVAAASGAVNSHHQTILMHPDAAGVANTSHLGNISRLPKPDLPLIHGYLPSVSDDDCFDQSFEFEVPLILFKPNNIYLFHSLRVDNTHQVPNRTNSARFYAILVTIRFHFLINTMIHSQATTVSSCHPHQTISSTRRLNVHPRTSHHQICLHSALLQSRPRNKSSILINKWNYWQLVVSHHRISSIRCRIV